MKEKLAALWAKVVEHKAEVIKTGGAVAGAVVGVVLAAVIANAMSEQPFDDDANGHLDEMIRETE